MRHPHKRKEPEATRVVISARFHGRRITVAYDAIHKVANTCEWDDLFHAEFNAIIGEWTDFSPWEHHINPASLGGFYLICKRILRGGILSVSWNGRAPAEIRRMRAEAREEQQKGRTRENAAS
ncbi:MAG: hypothetical protein II922_08565 [Succinimonas sp.]|nr:hypothetical protein [Succinimonas sp.]MEE3422990.1 hypothetical protein [Succinimonas sp.]